MPPPGWKEKMPQHSLPLSLSLSFVLKRDACTLLVLSHLFPLLSPAFDIQILSFQLVGFHEDIVIAVKKKGPHHAPACTNNRPTCKNMLCRLFKHLTLSHSFTNSLVILPDVKNLVVMKPLLRSVQSISNSL